MTDRAELRHLWTCGSFPPLLGEVAADHREADGGGYEALWGKEAKPRSRPFPPLLGEVAAAEPLTEGAVAGLPPEGGAN